MPDDANAFRAKLLATFRTEAAEHLEAISSGLLGIEKATGERRAALLEEIFREVHSLKGAARAVNLPEIERVCHAAESLFSGLKSGRTPWNPSIVDVVLRAADVVGRLVEGEDVSGAAVVASLDRAIRGRADEPPEDRAVVARGAAVRPPEPLPAPSPAAPTVRVRVEKLDSILRRAEELLGPRLAAAERVREIKEIHAELQTRDANGSHPGTLEKRVARLEKTAEMDRRALDALATSLLEDVKEAQMLPFATLLEGARRIVRDLAREQGKSVELIVSGTEIEIDRRILEEMRAPFAHLLRNAVDHGIESPETREKNGKPRSGTVWIEVVHQAGRVELSLRDDGAGIDPEAIRAAAARLGSVPAEMLAAYGDEEVLQLIFHSGLSTSVTVTEVSGRGLGLPIVREKVERLGGTIAVDSRPGAGTTVRIGLPLTLATMRGVLVETAGQRMVIPASDVERVTRVAPKDVRTVERRESIVVDGRTTPLVRLADVLEIARPSGEESPGRIPVVVLGRGGARIGFAVDSVLGEQEVLVKGLGPQLLRVRNVAGATVLGSGEVVPVLAAGDLLQSAGRGTSAAALAPAEPGAARRASILIVEDSITSRALLQQILEAAGFEVTAAVDGQEAWTLLRTERFDLVVSDVEMPRMDGFELTERIRADPDLGSLPVVLVTALDSREHRERGVDAGANAYIVKSRFDQSDLLDAVRRLV
ncbi:MAG: hybrid sensor histidine kinase/response regulator [Thermoanaerobaculia bacterium]